MMSAEPEISLINVKVRMGTFTLYTEKVYIDLQSPVSVLKDKMCEMDKTLRKDNCVMIYAGNIMEDRFSIRHYDVFNGFTVHLFKKIKSEIDKDPPKRIDYSNTEMVKLGAALRSLSLNFSYKCASLKISKATMLSDLIMSITELSNDPAAITFLQHPELLAKLNDVSMVKRIAERHPGLALVAIQISNDVQVQFVQVNLLKILIAYF